MAAQGLQEPSDRNIPPPTAAESALNPTRTIHYEYQHFLYTLNVSEYEDNDDFTCTRGSFYFALLSFSTRKQRAIQRFNMCAIQGPREDPVDAAIHAYSKLIINFINIDTPESRSEAFAVVEFLKTDYAQEMSDVESKTSYDQTKELILLLFGKDMLSHPDPASYALVYSQPTYYDMINLLIDIFGDEARFIDSSEIVKHLIFFYLFYRLPNMVNKYWEISPLTKAHFFAYILNTPAARQMTRSNIPMFDEIKSQISNLGSPLNTLLASGSYPEALRYVSESIGSNTLGGKKRTLRNKKKIKKTNKNNKNNKKTRPSRFSKK